MARHPYADYWDRGASQVPDMTGAKHLLDGHDLDVIFAQLDIDTPLPSVLDVGCGTGRMSQFADDYLGIDITHSAVEYCRTHGRRAEFMASIDDIPRGPFPWVTCISVFTHIDETERFEYLKTFAQITSNVLVDIIPGDGTGAVPLWTADPGQFLVDVQRAGFQVIGQCDHAWDQHLHRYYRLRREG